MRRTKLLATPTARDRDRLRQEVLEKLGWQLHRVWAPEWFHRRHQEVERLREVLEAAPRIAVPAPVVEKTPATNKIALPGKTTAKAPGIDKTQSQRADVIPAAAKGAR